MTDESRSPESGSQARFRSSGSRMRTGSMRAEAMRATPGASPWGVSDALTQMRDYEDEAALGRVWNRLESTRRRSIGSGPAQKVFLSAALVAAGALLGVFFEQQRSGAREEAAVASEIIETSVSAAPSNAERRARNEQRRVDGDDSSARRNRSLVRKNFVRPGPVAPVSEETDAVVEEVPNEGLVEAIETAPPEKASWLVSADQGDFATAFQQLDESGGFDAVVASGSPEELMTLAEVARYVGRNGRAIQALRAVTTRHESDPNAPIAAMILGNLLSRAGDQAGAAEAYALNRRLSPGGDFAEDALVREFDMAMADEDLASVQRLRAQYEAEFPEGRHLDDIRAEAERLAEFFAEAAESSKGDKPASDSSKADKSAHEASRSEKNRRGTDDVDEASGPRHEGEPSSEPELDSEEEVEHPDK